MRHLTVETILRHVDGQHDNEEAADIESHLASCAECREQAREFAELTTFLSEDRRNEPPAQVLSEAIQTFQPVLRPRVGGMARVLEIARRVFDSYEQPIAGTRGVADVPRQLLYRAGPLDIDLRIEVDEGRVSLAGQVLSESDKFPSRTPVHLEARGEVRSSTTTNAVGEFSFDDLPEDTYHLSLELPQGEVRLFCVSQGPSL